jgi:hypothetical protein
MRVVDFYAMGKQQSFLSEVALNLSAERSFPCASDHDVEDRSRRGDDDQEDGKQLEEDAVLHFRIILRVITTEARRD